jgi:two-component system chemotaxis response regulator CheY
MTQTDVSSNTKLRVMVADDNQETRRNIRLMLSMNPDVVVVAIAKDGQEAVNLFQEYRPDLVVLDIFMPVKDGMTAFKEITQIYPGTGCIIISAELPGAIPEDVGMPGMQEFLVKPFMIEELNDSVNRLGSAVWKNRQKLAEAERQYKESEGYLLKLAAEYAKTQRTDDQAISVFEQLTQNSACDLHWLRILALMYVVRQEWPKLKSLASRLEFQAKLA